MALRLNLEMKTILREIYFREISWLFSILIKKLSNYLKKKKLKLKILKFFYQFIFFLKLRHILNNIPLIIFGYR